MVWLELNCKEFLKNSDKELEVILSSRKDTDLFSFDQTQLIVQTKPDVVIIAAAKVGGILYNNTNRSEFILENLKINMNIFEVLHSFSKHQDN